MSSLTPTYTASVPLHVLLPEFGELSPVAVTDITTRSSAVTAGGLFLACQGYGGHGLEYLADALARQPAAVAWEPAEGLAVPDLPATVTGRSVPNLSARVGEIADRFFAQPSATVRVSAVTGTNGKTTTAWLVSQALGRLGVRAGYMGTLGYGIDQMLEPSSLTTPGCIAVHRRLRAMADAGAVAVCMEVSSHGLDQGRIDGVRLRTAGFTNLSRDHLDYHGSAAAYQAAKARLFQHPGLESAVINIDDAFGRQLADSCGEHIRVFPVARYGQPDAAAKAALTAETLAATPAGLQIRLRSEQGSVEFCSPLWGLFNVENLLVAAGMLLAQDFGLVASAEALAACTAPPGRLQRIGEGADGPQVVVDFAHTPDALQHALEAVRVHCAGGVWVVFGCGGDRDAGKRAAMGAIAAQYADHVILTNDNPRNEDPHAIIDGILAGIGAAVKATIIPDRAQAIRAAIAAANATDAVLIAGKGSEEYQLIGGRTVAFSDAAVAATVLGEAS